MALVCGIDLGSFNTLSYVAWLEDGEILLGSYTASVEQPLPPAPGGWAPAFTAIDGPQGLPVPGQRTRLCDREAGVPTKSLPASRDELAAWPLYRPFLRPFLIAGVELFWTVHEREIASVLGLVLLSEMPEAGVVCETYPRYVASRLWPDLRLPSKRRAPADYVEAVWSRLQAAGYSCGSEISRPDHVDAMLCAVAAEACLREDGIPAGTVGEAPRVDPAERVLREGFLIAPG
jgi:predicted nuclease with RNAse H fold